MDFNNQALMEFMKNIWTFYQNNSQYFDIKRVVEFLKELPLSFWIIATFMTWGWMFSSMLTTLSNVYFQQNDCAVQSTSAILHTVNQIVTSFQAAFQIVFTSLQAAFQIFFAGVTVTVSSHFPIICLCILFSMGIALLIASLLFSKGKQQWAFALIAVILAAPGYIYLVYWIIKSPKV
ncbi:uncharacterized protein EAE97_004609 [Botrytis byssoidea]|uniref:Uncharacterized protein n=1 Tax=Botrytis byssoidea TaxID=139641 RepID=A0A9P5M6Q3_9HELO|nr:uncharacterized protein EAE97_004609 [Botrytis byssoidea]KAF7947360.1 hypothetical protein EAE97_004609 [Botrytis byssoidea]